MRDFLRAFAGLLSDFASTAFFLVLFLWTHNTILSVGLGIALSLAQTGTQFVRGKPIATMEWMSLFLVVAGGAATLLTGNPRLMLFKPSVFYAIVGVVMLKPGWMNSYLPAIARAVVPDIARGVGFLWAGLMFVSAVVNGYLALTCSLASWALIMPIFGVVSKVVLFCVGFAAIKLTAVRRVRAMPAPERDALLEATGYS
jgi:intracellular septation protein